MALFKSLTFGNVNSMDYGVYITGAGVYNAPERAVEMYAIPGRNGALAIDGGRYENIEVTYNCGCFAETDTEFSEKIRAFRNAICSQYSYTRLTDEYNPDEYRMALYHSGLEVEPFRSKAGEFEITFDCKPQRFLTSGESTYQIGEWGQTITETGDIVTYQGDDLTAVKSLTTDMEPIQDLHGYDSPWVGGAGKNKLIYPYYQNSVTVNGVTATANSDGTVTVNGTCTATGSYMWLYGSSASNLMSTLKEGETYTYSLEGAVNGLNGQVIFYGSPSTVYNVIGGNTDKSVTFTVPDMSGYNGFAVVLAFINGFTYNNVTVKPMIRLSSVTDATYAPYSNICPIYGRTGQTVTVCGKNLFKPLANSSTINGITYTVNEDGTITVNGTATARSVFVISRNDMTGYKPIPSGEYVLSGCPDNVQLGYAVLNGWTGSRSFTDSGSGVSFTQPEITAATLWYVRIDIQSGQTLNNVVFKPMIRFASDTDATYEPYTGTTYTRAFVDGQGNTLTVYGGEDEIVGGVLTVSEAIKTYDGTENWVLNPNGLGRFYLNSLPSGLSTTDKASSISNQGTYGDNAQTYGSLFSFGGSGIYVNKLSASDTLDAFLARITGNNLQVVYPLATLLTYQLSANEVETLIGTNHVWSDAGEVTVEYGTDPYTMVNDTPFPSKPLIKVTGYGEVGFGDITITITGTAGVVTYIDCDLMECYRMSGGAIVPANQYVTFTGTDFPTIPTGKTRVTSASTISKVEVVPRWWII